MRKYKRQYIKRNSLKSKKKHLREEVFFLAPKGAKAYNRVGVESVFIHYPFMIIDRVGERKMNKV